MACCDLEATDCHGNTALIVALEIGEDRAVESLLERGACVHVVSSNGKIPLSIAFEDCDRFRTIILRLLDLGADLTLSMKDQKYLTKMVIYNRFHSVIQKLIGNGWPPADYPVEKRFQDGTFDSLSLFETALLFNNVRAARYFLANRFLTHRDVTKLLHSPRLTAKVNDRNFDGLVSWHWPIERNKLVKSLSESPFSLFTLSFVAISSLLEQNSPGSVEPLESLSLDNPQRKAQVEPLLRFLSSNSRSPGDSVTMSFGNESTTVHVDDTTRRAPDAALTQQNADITKKGSSIQCQKCHIVRKCEIPACSLLARKMSRIEKVRRLPLPEPLKKALLFQTKTAAVDPELWYDIPVDHV